MTHNTVQKGLPATTTIDHIRLRVHDLDESLQFYQGLLGLRAGTSENSIVPLYSVRADRPLLYLQEDSSAPARPPRTTGLFHVAFLYPSRKELAAVFLRLYRRGWQFQGFSDHGVSEALYLADPHGNGIELYADRPKEQWIYENGVLQLVTEPLDLQSLIDELKVETDVSDEAVALFTIGHIHLNVSSLQAAEEFYCKMLGFDVVTRNYPGALFISAGGYHHHLGLNVWNGRGAPPPPPGALGLVGYGIRLGNEDAVKEIRERLEQAHAVVRDGSEGLMVHDHDAIPIWLS